MVGEVKVGEVVDDEMDELTTSNDEDDDDEEEEDDEESSVAKAMNARVESVGGKDVMDDEELVGMAMNPRVGALDEVMTERKVVDSGDSGLVPPVLVSPAAAAVGVDIDCNGVSGIWDEESGAARMAASVASAGAGVSVLASGNGVPVGTEATGVAAIPLSGESAVITPSVVSSVGGDTACCCSRFSTLASGGAASG